jgi:hypothetical protein
MEQSTPPKRKQTIPILLYFVFLMAEIFFFSSIVDVDEDSALSKTALFSAFIFPAYDKKLWAIWTVGILLLLQGLMCIGIGLEEGLLTFHMAGLFYILYGAYIFNFRTHTVHPRPTPSQETQPELHTTHEEDQAP